jgi:hypothetical protein
LDQLGVTLERRVEAAAAGQAQDDLLGGRHDVLGFRVGARAVAEQEIAAAPILPAYIGECTAGLRVRTRRTISCPSPPRYFPAPPES